MGKVNTGNYVDTGHNLDILDTLTGLHVERLVWMLTTIDRLSPWKISFDLVYKELWRMLSILISLLLFIAFENQILNRLGLFLEVDWDWGHLLAVMYWCTNVWILLLDRHKNNSRTCISFTKLAFLLKCCDLQVERKCILHFDEICKYKIHIISRSVYQKQKLRCWGWHSTPPRDTCHISTHIYTYLHISRYVTLQSQRRPGQMLCSFTLIADIKLYNSHCTIFYAYR